MTGSNNRFLLIYGTQTGQSKAIAEEIVERCDKVGIDADIHCFSKIEKEFVLEREPLVVIVVSTTGDGEPPDTTLKFWRRVKRRTLLKTHFSTMRYSLLGLGDSNYNNHCRFPHMLNDRLLELGATHFVSADFADDAVGLDVVAEPWIDSLLLELCKIFNLPPPSDDNKAANAAQEIIKDMKAKLTVSDLPNGTVAEDPRLEMTNGDSLANGDVIPVDSSDSKKSSHTSELSTAVENDTSSHQQSWISDIPSTDVSSLNLPSCPSPYIDMEYLSDTDTNSITLPIQNNCKLPFADSPVYHAPLIAIERLSAKNECVKTALLVELNSSEFTGYQSGDSFSVIAQNDEREVDWLLRRLNIANPKQLVRLSVRADTTKKKASVPEYMNSPSSLHDIFTRDVDLRGIPKKAMLRLLAESCTDSHDQEKLLLLSSRQGTHLYRQMIVECKRGLLDILYVFPSCTPPVQSLLENLPRLLPRAYSVASGSNSKSLRFAFNVIDLPSIGPLTNRQGLVTGHFHRIFQHKETALPKIGVYLRTQQHFRLPTDISKPLILIGPGTGVAPFLGFLQDREKLSESGDTLGECLLFFGNRMKDGDFLFREELERHLSTGNLSKLHVCFSRDTEHIERTGAKYVTDLIRQQSAHLSHLITNKSAYIYVCGDAKNMAKDVNQTITQILQSENGYTDDEVLTVVKELRDEKRYKEDVWV